MKSILNYSAPIAIALIVLNHHITAIQAQSSSSSSSSCDACLFVDADSSDCKVYGQLGDDILIPWHRASQECLDLQQIKVQSVNPDTLTAVFPNPDGSNGNIAAFVNMLRFDASLASVNSVRLSLEDLFDEDPNQNGISVLKDVIVVNGVTYNCQTNASDCWNKALREYFAMEPGISEMMAIGSFLYDRLRFDKELEQSTVRINLCREGSDETCEPLLSQVQEYQASNPDKACSAFGLGPAENKIPGCENLVTGTTDSSGATTSIICWETRFFAGSVAASAWLLAY